MTNKLLRGLGLFALAAGALCAGAAAQTGPGEQAASNPVCVRLEGQLAVINRGAVDPARADQIRRAEDAAAKQQADLDRALAQAKKQGCEGGGFFALFTGRLPQCGPLNAQIQQMRDNLDRTMTDLEHLKSNSDQEGQRAALIQQLAQNNCGAQYRAAAAPSGPGSFFSALFGGTIISPGGDGAPAGTYRTVCVRTCDGYYFPISYSTVPNRFADDQRSCQRLCPAAEAVIYSYRNPGEDIGQAVSINGHPYTELPSAFHYRKDLSPGCSCRRPGQSWADALRNADDATTLEAGDIVVTEQKAKALSQPLQQAVPGKDARQPDPPPAAAEASAPDPNASPRSVRTVGPPFVAAR